MDVDIVQFYELNETSAEHYDDIKDGAAYIAP